MPELPEVEAIRLQLERFLVGDRIERLEVRNEKYRIDEKNIVNSKITGVRRFGKALVIDLSSGYSIVAHVKMTGQFIYKNKREGIGDKISPKVVGGLGGKHTHVIFHLDKGGTLYFNDYRRFGWMKLAQSSKLKAQSEFIGKLGKEFLKDLTVDEFSEIVSKSKKPIKVLLMDQSKMAGVGNIYANDALWLAKVNPQRKAESIKPKESQKLFEAVETVLKEGIKRGGASELAFVTPDGSEGHYQDFTLVYGREGKPCKVCKTPIKKIKLGGRGTYFCPKCQG